MKFKVGDKVRRTCGVYTTLPKGTVCTVVAVDAHGSIRLEGFGDMYWRCDYFVSFNGDDMKFMNTMEVRSYFNDYRRGKRGNTTYPITAKRAVMELLATKADKSIAALVGVTIPTISTWREQWVSGAYDNMDGVVAVSAKAKKAHNGALDQLTARREELNTEHEAAIKDLDATIISVKFLQQKGYDISKRVA